jgi:hypothetical protein
MSRFRIYRGLAKAVINRPAPRPQTRGDLPGGAGFPPSSARSIFQAYAELSVAAGLINLAQREGGIVWHAPGMPDGVSAT